MAILSFWEWSVSASLMIGATALVRRLWGERLPRRVFPLLWWLATARLLLPLSVASPASAGALLGLPPASPPRAAAFQSGGGLLPPLGAAADTAITPPTAFPVWGALWLLGTLAMAVYFCVGWRRFRRRFAVSLPAEGGFAGEWLARRPLVRPLRIRRCPGIGAPLTYGVFRPVILLPGTGWDDRRRLEIALAHEYAHIRRFDAAAKLLITAALCLHWWNPLVWWMSALAGRDMELCCDEEVLDQLGQGGSAAYARILLDMEEEKCGPPPRQ